MKNMGSKNGITDKNRQAKLLKAIEQGSDKIILSMLIDLREHGEIFYLETLMGMAIGGKSDTLKKAIVRFISDVKAKDAAPVIANFIRKNKGNKEIIRLVAACWQSVLDFSNHLDTFFDIFIESDYECSFEAFTVIENNISQLTTGELSKYTTKLNQEISSTSKEKQPLLQKMVRLLDETKKAAQQPL